MVALVRISMPRRNRFVTLTTTIDSPAKAGKLARQIVRSRLAACVQSMPIRSVYWWKKSVESAGEILLIAKTRASRAKALIGFIQERHPYEVPEIVVTPIIGGSKDYLTWIEKETT